MSGLKYMSSLCSISDLPWERRRVSWSRRSFGRVSSPKKHQVSVDTSAPENPCCAMAGHYRGCHHGLLPALWAKCCKCPSSGRDISWCAPFFLFNTRIVLCHSTTSTNFYFWQFPVSSYFATPACGQLHGQLYHLWGFFKQQKRGGETMLC